MRPAASAALVAASLLFAAAAGCERESWPACDPARGCGAVTDHACRGDDMRLTCSSGYTCATPCEQLCRDDGYTTYLGACGTSFNGQASPTGDDVCWCA